MDDPMDPDGLDLEGYAADRDGHLGHFTSCGSRVILPAVPSSRAAWKRLYDAMMALPPRGRARPVVRFEGTHDEAGEMAERGFFSHDFVSADTDCRERGH
jgi:hypothetical protein